MVKSKIKVSGVGCSLLDSIYTGITFTSDDLRNYFSLSPGDGGIVPGELVFSEDLEKYANEKLDAILDSIIMDRENRVENIGGPSIVALILASQLLYNEEVDFSFFGAVGNDNAGQTLRSLLENTDINLDAYKVFEGETPGTIVLSDPDFNKGNGERAFINTLGVAATYDTNLLKEDFYHSDILFFGGTALVPHIHDSLHDLLKEGKRNKCINIVTTVFDFRNENKSSSDKWPLGKGLESFKLMDLLVMDRAEAMRISGTHSLEDAATFFKQNSVGAFIITQGTEKVLVYSSGILFEPVDMEYMPILPSEAYRKEGTVSDTTGCGDNFAGGVLASIILQKFKPSGGKIDLKEACSLGIASGTLTSLVTGGVTFESYKGQKYSEIMKLKQDYAEQYIKYR